MNTGLLLGVLFFAVIIYFMMRKGGGCCGHSHGKHDNPEVHSSGESGTGTSKDPVCGMTVVEANAAGASEYRGKTYYFCVTGCRESFEKDPEKFANAAAEHEQKYGCCG
jgi:YHS domain-containing protein